jgi:hypothetical protein
MRGTQFFCEPRQFRLAIMLASYVIILVFVRTYGALGAFITEFLSNDIPDEVIITSLGSNKSNKHIPEDA